MGSSSLGMIFCRDLWGHGTGAHQQMQGSSPWTHQPQPKLGQLGCNTFSFLVLGNPSFGDWKEQESWDSLYQPCLSSLPAPLTHTKHQTQPGHRGSLNVQLPRHTAPCAPTQPLLPAPPRESHFQGQQGDELSPQPHAEQLLCTSLAQQRQLRAQCLRCEQP